MTCPYECKPKDGQGPPREVSISEVRMRIHDMKEPYAVSDDEIRMRIRDATLMARVMFNIEIDPSTGFPATDLDALFVALLASRELLQSYMIQISGGSSSGSGESGGGAGGCGGASFAHNNFIDSISEGGSSISFSSISDLQNNIDKISEQLEQLKIGRWGCAIYVTTGNY